jgi:hypothetical protein
MTIWSELRPQSNTDFYFRIWPVGEIAIDEITDRFPPFDSLTERQLRSEQMSMSDDRSASIAAINRLVQEPTRTNPPDACISLRV